MKKGIPVVLQVSTNGIKVLDENENVSILSKLMSAFEIKKFLMDYEIPKN